MQTLSFFGIQHSSRLLQGPQHSGVSSIADFARGRSLSYSHFRGYRQNLQVVLVSNPPPILLTTLSYVQFQSIATRGKSSAKILLKGMLRCCNRCLTKHLSHNSRLTDQRPTFTKLHRALCRNTDTAECYIYVAQS